MVAMEIWSCPVHTDLAMLTFHRIPLAAIPKIMLIRQFMASIESLASVGTGDFGVVENGSITSHNVDSIHGVTTNNVYASMNLELFGYVDLWWLDMIM